jgi:flagellar basal-body rod protein FlgC
MPIPGASMNIFNLAASAMNAQSQRMNVTASNLANADSVSGPDGQPYRAKQVVFQLATQSAEGIGGVEVAGVVQDESPLRTAYDPKNPRANASGYVSLPNVNVVEEMTNMISASRSYQANVEVLNTAKTMMSKTLTIGQ